MDNPMILGRSGHITFGDHHGDEKPRNYFEIFRGITATAELILDVEEVVRRLLDCEVDTPMNASLLSYSCRCGGRAPREPEPISDVFNWNPHGPWVLGIGGVQFCRSGLPHFLHYLEILDAWNPEAIGALELTDGERAQFEELKLLAERMVSSP